MTEGQPPAPEYFVYDAMLNRKERGLLDETRRRPTRSISTRSTGSSPVAR